MELLISFYDNALIYYPNIFFAALFFVSFLGIIVLWRKVKRIIEEIKSNLKQIKKEKSKKMHIGQIIRIFIAGNRILFLQVAIAIYVRTNKAFVHVESQVEKIIKKIGREILIEK
jgi:hypothetical protein